MPVGHVGHGGTNEIVHAGVALFVHPFRQAADHLLHDLEAIGHGRGADLHVACAQGHELGRIAPGGHAADAADGQAVQAGVAGDL